MTRKPITSSDSQDGFTIIELLIATVVFAVVLMLVTTGVMHFSNQYYKAVNANATQNLVRTISEDITQSLQFSGTDIAGTTPDPGHLTEMSTLCINTKKYWYRLGVQYTGTESLADEPGLYVTKWDTGDHDCADGSIPDGKQLLQKNMRIAKLEVKVSDDAADLYNVTLRIAYGDSDLLCSPDVAGSCDRGFANNNDIATNGDTVDCRPVTGSQFCAVSNINALVQKRVSSE